MKRIKEGLLVLVISIVLFCFLEILSRIIFKGEPNPQPVNSELLAYEFDSLSLLKMKADITKVFIRNEVNGGDTIFWQTDSMGFRGRDKNKVKSGRKIMVFGDSNVQGRFSSYENTYCSKLETYLNNNSTDSFTVINAGTIGFGPDQSFVKIKQTIPQIKPEKIILQVFADNDYGDLIRNRLFEVDKNDNLVKTGLKTIPDIKLSGKVQNTKRMLRIVELLQYLKKKYFDSVKKSDAEIKDAEIASLINLCKNEYSLYKKKETASFSIFADHYDIDLAILPESESARAKLRLMELLLIEINEYLSSVGVELLVLVQPSAVDLTSNFNLSYEDLRGFDNYDKKRLSGSIEAICRDNDIPCLNLFTVFNAVNPSELYFKFPNNHWNDEGQRLAAFETSRLIN